MHTSHWNGLISCRSSSTVVESRGCGMTMSHGLCLLTLRGSFVVMNDAAAVPAPMMWLTGSVPRDSMTSVGRRHPNALIVVLGWCRRGVVAEVEEGIRPDRERVIYSASCPFYRWPVLSVAVGCAIVCCVCPLMQRPAPFQRRPPPLLPTPPAWPGFHSSGS